MKVVAKSNNIKKKNVKKSTKKSANKTNYSSIKDNISNYLKNLTIKNYLNIGLLLLIIIFSTWLFYKYKVYMFFPDGKNYYRMAKIILGNFSMSEWQVCRGFGFPLIVASWIKLLGDNQFGISTGIYIFYMTFVFTQKSSYQRSVKIGF